MTWFLIHLLLYCWCVVPPFFSFTVVRGKEKGVSRNCGYKNRKND